MLPFGLIRLRGSFAGDDPPSAWTDKADIEGGGAMAGATCPEVIEEGICRDGAKEHEECEHNLRAEGAPPRQ